MQTIQSLVSDFTANLMKHIETNLKQSFASLDGAPMNGAPAPKRRGRKPAPEKAAPEKAAPKAVKAERATRGSIDHEANVKALLAFVKKNNGATSEAVRAGLGMAKPLYQVAVTKAVAAGDLKKKGVKRATTLHVK